MFVDSCASIRCAYLVISHTSPEGIARLARTIIAQSPAAHVFVHHDAAAGRFPDAIAAELPQLTIVDNPVHVTWGTFSQVEAVLRLLRQMRSSAIPFDWAALISGQDFPARPIPDFEFMLERSDADAIMMYEPIGPGDHHLNDRYRFRYHRLLKGPLPRILRAGGLYDRMLNRSQPFVRVQSGRRGTFIGIRPIRSVFDLHIPVYKGCQWWALSRKAIDVVLSTIERQPDLIECYQGTLIPDESFFQTIVVNSPELRTTNAALHYADWRSQDASPRFLTIDDLVAVRNSGQWFARKIDAASDRGLRDALATI